MRTMMQSAVVTIAAVFLAVAGVSVAYGQQNQLTAGNVDKRFTDYAIKDGMLQVALANEAVTKSTNTDVEDVAHRVMQDHSKWDQQLTQLAQKDGFQVPNKMSGDREKKLQKLSGLSGPKFDRAYIRYEIKDQKKDIKEFTNEATAGNDPGLKSFASQAVPELQWRLSRSETIDQKLGASQRSKLPWWEFWKKV
jgi:putative membrane protein